MNSEKEISGEPTFHYYVQIVRNTGSSKGGDTYEDGTIIVPKVIL